MRLSTEAYGPFFIDLNILIYTVIYRQKRTPLNQLLPPTIQPATSPQPHLHDPDQEGSPKTPWACHGSLKKREQRML